MTKAVEKKDSNPKQSVGTKKPPMSVVSQAVMAEVGVGMLEGARKYGRHNWREAGAMASTYFDATQRHLNSWWEGEDIDPDSGLSHVTKAITSLMVLRDAMIQENMVDDRPPKTPESHKAYLQELTDAVFERIPEAVDAYTELNTNKSGK